ncbi:beta-N-acetylhexosaminidase [Alphaproteobacteria bacterium KMM 3653]|uniref:beta-N-acetylhexosaminidase n=1 Tax=Harenicola maris TaxID=2841044 RepID=A0AAP2CP20_9RHOB|nr:beta-N-acetylhexosaminidase [Harenicola maris]
MRGIAPCILGCSGPVLTASEAAFFADAKPWGFILFARNVETPDQLRRLTADLRSAVGRDAPILVDQEGGRVQRLRAPHWREWLPPMEQMQRARDPIRAMQLRYALIAAELRDVGIDVNCAPQADLARPETHRFLRNRCYSEQLGEVIAAARACATGLIAGGALPVLKHIPGHGLGLLDSHKELPVTGADEGTLMANDFAAFKALADLPMAMTAHLIYSAIDPDLPATISPKVIDLIRTHIGFEGLLMTDDISMEALSGAIPDRAAAALRAGCDIVLHCNGDMAEMAPLIAEIGKMPPWTADRAEAALTRRPPAGVLDTQALEEEFADLMEGV